MTHVEHDDTEESAEAALERNLKRLRTEGLDAAAEAALTILRDPKSPAQARSATINAVFRASGLFGRSDDDADVPESDMSPDQLNRTLRRLERKLLAAAQPGAVFE